MSKVIYAVSFYDVNHILKQVGKCVDMLTKQEIEQILFYVGMEIPKSKEVEVEEVLHRPRYSPNNEPWFGKRWIGFERQDKEWLFSSKCSLENVIQSQTDMDHKRDLVIMSQQSTSNIVEFAESEQFRHSKQELAV